MERSLGFYRNVLGFEVTARVGEAKTPLAIALEYKQPEIAKLLRERGAAE